MPRFSVVMPQEMRGIFIVQSRTLRASELYAYGQPQWTPCEIGLKNRRNERARGLANELPLSGPYPDFHKTACHLGSEYVREARTNFGRRKCKPVVLWRIGARACFFDFIVGWRNCFLLLRESPPVKNIRRNSVSSVSLGGKAFPPRVAEKNFQNFIPSLILSFASL